MTLSELTRVQPRKKMYPLKPYSRGKPIFTIEFLQSLNISHALNHQLIHNGWKNPYEGMYNYDLNDK